MLTAFVATRRTVLRGAVVASAYALMSVHGQLRVPLANAAASPNVAFLTQNAAYATAKCYDAAWTQEVITSFPLRFGLSERAEPLTLNVTWDSRLFEVHGPVLAITEGKAREVSLASAEPGQFSMTVDPKVSELVFQVESLSTYPNDNLDAVSPTRLSLTDDAGAVVAELVADSTFSNSAPWSVEISVDWVSYEKDIVPARIVLRSIGPNPAPGALVIVAAYADVLSLPTVTVPQDAERAPATASEQSSGGITELKIVTHDELAPNSQIELLFSAEASDSIPAPFSDFVPYLRLNTPAETRDQRASGRHESYPVTGSGSQLSTYLPAPSAG